jgi:small subunit ribosomal protein S19
MEEIIKKQFTYRGNKIEDLMKLETREFAKLVKSKNRRSILRNFQEIENFVNRSKIKLSRNKSIRTHKRDLIIIPAMIDMKISVYNGQKFIPILIIPEMLGHRLGEFALTRAKINHGKAGVGATKGTKHKSKK